MEVIEKNEPSTINRNSRSLIRGENNKKGTKSSAKDFEIENLNYLAFRSEESLQSDLKKHVEEFMGVPIFSKINMFSAFKSTTDYFIAEFRVGYAIFVNRTLKTAKRDKRGYCDVIYSSKGYYCCLDKDKSSFLIFDEQAKDPPKIFGLDLLGRFSPIEGIPYLIPFPGNQNIILIKINQQDLAIFSLRKEKVIYQFEKIEEFVSVVCRGRNTFIFLRKSALQDSSSARNNAKNGLLECKFVLEVLKLKNEIKDRFRMVNRRRHQMPKLLALGPREEHLLVTTMNDDREGLGWIYLFKLSTKGCLTYLSCIDFSNSGAELEDFSCLKFHGFFKTKMIFSGFSSGRDIDIFTVVYDIRSKKVALARFLKTKLSTVRNLSLLGSSLYGFDDHCRRFEVRI